MAQTARGQLAPLRDHASIFGPQDAFAAAPALRRSGAPAAVAAAVTSPAAVTAAASARFTRTGLVDFQGPALVGLAIQRLHGSVRFIVVRHFHEPEATAATCFSILNYLCRLDHAKLREQLLQLGIIYAIGQIAHVQPFHDKNSC
jgi:hypothetical protein